MAKLDYSADSAPLPPSSLVLQVGSDLTDAAYVLATANAATATDTTCAVARLFIG